MKVFFLVGFPRSGTSFLVKLLNKHPHISLQHESKFIPEYYDKFCKLFKQQDFRRIALDISSKIHGKARYTGVSSAEVLEDYIRLFKGDQPLIAYRELVAKAIINPNKTEALVIGDKTPNYVFHVKFLSELFPEAKFIHLVRDGRDAFLSIKDLNWGPGNVLFAAMEWKKYLKAWDANQTIIPESNRMELSYEELIQNTSASLTRIFSFLELSSVHYEFTNLGTLANNSFKWKNKFNMSKLELAVFQHVAGNWLDKYKYERFEKPLKLKPIIYMIFFIDQAWKFCMNKSCAFIDRRFY